MQVTHVQDHITHANIGMKQKETIDFGISNDAAFFNILSSTLYKNQPLAVVRETICNANDAHIEAGVDLPIEITLTNELFTIRDFGSGIHKDDMGTIYGTYGNSTKKNDGMQTGGFGLGCKAPFAYTDHFDVHSFHDGIKTIYNLSKSSAAAQGKPGITPIISIPTTETGLMVSIPMKTVADRHVFESLVKKIVHNGDMNVKLNGVQLKKFGFTNETNYIVTSEGNLIQPQTQIMVRYGHVIYPVDHHQNLSALEHKISHYLGKMRNRYYVVLQAKPHSIAVTPSRETLSMQDHTVAALKELMESFLSQITENFDKHCKVFLENGIKDAVGRKDTVRLLDARNTGYPFETPHTPSEEIRSSAQFAQRYMEGHYPTDIESVKRDWKIRMIEMSKAGMLDRGKVMTFLRDLEEYKGYSAGRWGYQHANNFWLQKNVTGPLITKLMKAGIDWQRLYVHDVEDRRRDKLATYDMPFIPANLASAKHLLNCVAYLRNIIVVSPTKREAMSRARQHPLFTKTCGTQGILFYHLGSKLKERTAAIEFFKNSGMQVIDLTVRQPWEPEKKKQVTVPKVEKAPGWAAFSSIINEHNIMDFRHSKERNVARVVKPEFVLNVSMASGERTNSTRNFDTRSLRTIVKYWGDKGCITNNDTLNEKLLGLGAKPFDKFIRDEVLKYMTTEPNALGYWAHQTELLVGSSSLSHDMVTRIMKNDVMRKQFNITYQPTPKTLEMVYLFHHVSAAEGTYAPSHSDEYKAAKAIITAIKPAPEAAAMIQKLVASPLLCILNLSVFEQLMIDTKTTQTLKDDAMAVFNLLIN